MSLWTMTDDEAGKPKYLSDTLRNAQTVSDKDSTIGINAAEALDAGSAAKGLRTPGWVTYTTYTDANGNVRHKSEVLVAAGSMGSDGTQTLVDDLSTAPTGEITGTMTIGTDSGSYGAGQWSGTPAGSLDETPAGSLAFITGNSTMTTIMFGNGTFGDLTISNGTINGHTTVIVNVGGVTRTFTKDVMGQYTASGDVFNLQAQNGQTVAFGITLA